MAFLRTLGEVSRPRTSTYLTCVALQLFPCLYEVVNPVILKREMLGIKTFSFRDYLDFFVVIRSAAIRSDYSSLEVRQFKVSTFVINGRL